MKIIYYKDEPNKWWIGKQGDCVNCKEFKVEIEEGDVPDWVGLGSSYLHATFQCPKCKGPLSVMNK